MTVDEEATIIMLYREGLLHTEITERCDISKATVYEVLKRNHVPIDRRKGRTETTEGYVKILLSPDHPCYPMAEQSGYIKEHRLVMALHLGRLLEPDEQIHHINGNKGDNRIANLQLVFRGHGNGVVMKCRACGSYDIESTEKAQRKEERMYAPGVVQELKEWADEGLIPAFDQTSLYDDVFVEVLRAIRKRLKSDEPPST